MSEERPPTGSIPPADDLRSLIAGVVAEDKKGAAAAPAEGETPADTAVGGEAARGIGDNGGPPLETERREAASAADVGEPPAGEAAAASPEGGEAKPEETAKPGAITAPEHWSADDKKQFETLPEAARGPFLTLYKRMEAGFTPKLQRGAQLERDYGGLDQSVFTPPIREILRGKGINDPRQLIEGWASVEMGLVNEQTRNEVIARLIHMYRADPGQVADHLHRLRGFAPAGGGDSGRGNGGGPPPVANGGGAPPLDPALNQRLMALEGESQRRQQDQTQAALNGAANQIQAFANETDGEGNLTHPFFAELEADMTLLAQLDRSQNREPALKDLYDRALWANPSTRQRQQALEQAAKDRKAAEERRAKSEQARRAGSSVSGAPAPGRAASEPQADRTLRDTIRASMNGGATSGGPGRI